MEIYFSGFLLVFSFVIIVTFIASMRKGTSVCKTKPFQLYSHITNLDVANLINIIADFASKFGYKIDYFDESTGRIILSDSTNYTSYGFFYPIYLSKLKDGDIKIEIGIKSKLHQSGPLVTRYLERCYYGILLNIYKEETKLE